MAVAQVAEGDDVLATQFNAIVTFLQSTTSGHTHTGANSDGKQVSHASLSDGVISGRTNSHAQIDSHIAATSAIHGLGTGVKPQGTSNSTVYVMEYGFVAGDGGTATTTFSFIAGVVATAIWGNPGGNAPPIAVVHTVINVTNASTFDVSHVHTDPNPANQGTCSGISWIAWGTK